MNASKIRAGDSVCWTDPDGGEMTVIKVAGVTVRGDVVVLATSDGDVTEALACELSAADDVGREAARKVIAEADAPTREQIAALQAEAAAAGDDAMVAICAAALDGDPVALVAAAQCISDAAAQRDE